MIIEDLTVTVQAIEKRRSHVEKSLLSLPKDTVVYYDTNMEGCYPAFLKMLDIPIKTKYRMHVQDDVIFADNFLVYLPQIMKDVKENDFDVLSLFAPKRKKIKEGMEKGLKYDSFPDIWIQCVIFKTEIHEGMKDYIPQSKQTKWDDVFMVEYMSKNRIKSHVHLPSLVQHDINMGSSVGNANSVNRMSPYFDKNYITKLLTKNK